MEQTFTTKSIDERNKFIYECYWLGIKYSYWDKNNEGNYIVKYKEK